MEIKEIRIPAGENNKVELRGDLCIPVGSTSFVIFSHGSGSSRFSVRNKYVAKRLNDQKIATLLTDLLTEEEDKIFESRFNIDLLTERLIDVTLHMHQIPGLQDMKIGYFGASTGAASALKAAARLDAMIQAVVSRGGRPDLANQALKEVKAPTLLIVGSLDKEVIKLNEISYDLMKCEKRIEIVKGASHLFEEPGKLDEVSVLAIKWFTQYLHPEGLLVSNKEKDDTIH